MTWFVVFMVASGWELTDLEFDTLQECEETSIEIVEDVSEFTGFVCTTIDWRE